MAVKSNLSIYQRYQRYYAYLSPVASDPLIRGYFSLVASLLLVAFFLVFALSPTFNTIVVLQKKITDQRLIVSSLDSKISALISAQDVYSQIEKQVYLLDMALPSKPNPQGMAADVVSTASSSGISLVSLQFQTIPLSKDADAKIIIANGLPTVSFNVSLVGSQDKIRGYIGELEKQLRYLRFINLSINLGDGKGSVTADMTGLGYYLVN